MRIETYDDFLGFNAEQGQMIEEKRWATIWEYIVKDPETDKYFAFYVDEPATENQEPDSYGLWPQTGREVEKRSVMVEMWVEV